MAKSYGKPDDAKQTGPTAKANGHTHLQCKTISAEAVNVIAGTPPTDLSAEAVNVIAGTPPTDLLVKERRDRYKGKKKK
ncbi:hypothetical protein QE152_g31989 [Popillia japonica]|uniref:Uncharacterized protein n=1 Tax=Popillia japonica TaxID=7064 RepID=A0AAW1J194_POPJA